MITLLREHVDEMFAHAREMSPEECCGLIGGSHSRARTIYRLRNAAAVPLVGYEAAPEELFAAQRLMRARVEQLLAIYHSHPHSEDPRPSASDVRLAFYPEAVYFIIGFTRGGEGVLGAFRIYEAEGRWERAEFRVVED
jgi:proteasome lid subunit RPN8/RPN11